MSYLSRGDDGLAIIRWMFLNGRIRLSPIKGYHLKTETKPSELKRLKYFLYLYRE